MKHQPMRPWFETLEQAGVGPVFVVGPESAAFITQLRPTAEHPNAVGNVRRGSCEIGKTACENVCQFDRTKSPLYCADQNVGRALELAGVNPQRTLVVAATRNTIGFAGQVAGFERNTLGWQQLDDYNAFFARPEQDGIAAIGAKMADCACLFFECTDREGKTVIGFEHSTKINMRGPSAYARPDLRPFTDAAGRPVPYTHSVLSRAIAHYGADPSSFHIRLVSGIKPENYTYTFKDKERMEAAFPGLYAAGFLQNTNAKWDSSQEVNPQDIWHVDAHALILWDIATAMQELHIPSANFSAENAIDPAEQGGPHSSHVRKEVLGGDFRDLYLLVHRSALQR